MRPGLRRPRPEDALSAQGVADTGVVDEPRSPCLRANDPGPHRTIAAAPTRRGGDTGDLPAAHGAWAEAVPDFANGKREARNETHATELFPCACEVGSALGCKLLGAAYEGGRGVPANGEHAVSLFQKACELGDQEACRRVGVKRRVAI